MFYSSRQSRGREEKLRGKKSEQTSFFHLMSQKAHTFCIYSDNSADMQKFFKPFRYFDYNDLFQDLYQPWSVEWEEWGA